MLHVEVSIAIRAPQARVIELYRTYRNWPQLFPATIQAVRLVKAEPTRTILEVAHREGRVLNVLTELGPQRIDLWEAKRRYDATFINRFETVPEGTRYTVSADIALKGVAKLLGPLLRGYVRRQITRCVLEPMRQAAEQPRPRPPGAAQPANCDRQPSIAPQAAPDG